MPTLRTFVVFALVGPPLGWLVFASGLILEDLRSGKLQAVRADDLSTVIVGIPFSYLIGLVPALVTALLMIAGSRLFRIRAGASFAALVGLLTGIAFASLFRSWTDGWELGVPRYFTVLKVLTCLVPTLICWWLARPKRADAIEPGNEIVKS